MAEKTMNRAVMVGERTYRTGEEDALDAALTPDQVKALKRRKVLAGDFKGQKDPEDAEVERQEEGDATRRSSDQVSRQREALRKAAEKQSPRSKDTVETFSPIITGEGEALDDDFPAREELAEAGITTADDVRGNLDNLEKIPGIGSAKAKQIRASVS